MQSTNDQAVHVLNSLIETTLDSANGYRDASEGAESPQLKSLFSQKAERRLELTRKLQQEVRSFGAEPEDDQSLLGKAHNKFAEMRGKLTENSDTGVVDEVERGEDFIKAKFEEATKEDLPQSARQLIVQAFASIEADHNEVSRLKQQLHASH